VSISQLILMVEQIYMLSKLNDVPDLDPQFIDYFKIVCQHVLVILLFCLELFYLQGDDDYDYKSIKSVATFYLIQATTYATVPWFTSSETLQSYTAQVLQQTFLCLCHNYSFPVPLIHSIMAVLFS
jgi:hypothetical protein